MTININPKCADWRVEETKLNLKAEFDSESLLKVTYGSWEDLYSSDTLWVYMRKSVYTNLINGKYVSQFRDGVSGFKVFDLAGNEIHHLYDYIY